MPRPKHMPVGFEMLDELKLATENARMCGCGKCYEQLYTIIGLYFLSNNKGVILSTAEGIIESIIRQLEDN